MIASEEIRILQKEISLIFKKIRGVGPQIHFVKDLGTELHIIVKGTLTPVEKYYFQTYGQEYFDAVYKFYLDTIKVSIKELEVALQSRYQFSLLRLEPDFKNDIIKYIVHYTQNKE